MEPNPPTARRSGSSLLCKTSQRSACSSTSAAAGQRRMDPFSDGTGMKKGLLTLPSAEMCTWCACWVAARIAGGDREAIQQPQAIFEAFGRRRLPILRRQHRPEPGEGLAPPPRPASTAPPAPDRAGPVPPSPPIDRPRPARRALAMEPHQADSAERGWRDTREYGAL